MKWFRVDVVFKPKIHVIAYDIENYMKAYRVYIVRDVMRGNM